MVSGALGAPAHPPPSPYHPPAPAPYHAPHPAPYHEEKAPPKPFAYEYGGVDDYGNHFQKAETQDEYGVVQGEYRVELPDGRTQIVTYHADHENGFVADVKYEGEASPDYHPKPYHPAPHPAPYKPAPAPYHPAPAPYHPAPAPYHEEIPKDYQFGYEVNGYDEYGNPNNHGRTEAREGNTVKGQYR